MDKYLDPAELQRIALEWWQWILDHVLLWSTALQALTVVAAFVLARIISPFIARQIEKLANHSRNPGFVKSLLRSLPPLCLPVVWLLLQWFSVFAAEGAGWPNRLIESVVSLLTAWVVIRFASSVIRNPAWARSLAVIAWTVAALNLLGLLDPTLATLDSMAFSMGDIRLSALGVLKSLAVLLMMLWIAGFISRIAEHRLESVKTVSPSAKVLLGKLIKVLLVAVAVITALESIGIDLTALAVFGGAIGLGIGFGLQKVFSNLMSGVILLLDKSVKPGDVIAIDETFGWINRLSARYVSVITRDGTEHLIPNEDLISQRVENWSYSDSLIRLKLPIGVAYDSDVPKAMELAVEAAKQVERVLDNPQPVCRLMNFGSDAVELELRIWIDDPQRGVANVQSDVLLLVWNLYHENDIVFPFSQHDLHLRSSVPLDVRLSGGDTANDEGKDNS